MCSEFSPYASHDRFVACVPLAAPCELCVSNPPSSHPATRVPLLLVASDSRSDRAQTLSARKKPYDDVENIPGGKPGLVASLTGKSEKPVPGSFGSQVDWLQDRYSSSVSVSLTSVCDRSGRYGSRPERLVYSPSQAVLSFVRFGSP